MNKNITTGLFIVGGVFAVGIVAYAGYTLKTNLDNTQEALEQTQNELEQTTQTLAERDQENTFLLERLQSEQQRNDNLEERVEEAEEALGIIVKRQSLDEELLAKYSKVYFLNENYRPDDLDRIPQRWIWDDDDEYIHGDVRDFLIDMLEDAQRDDIDLRIISAFRSFDEQAQLKGQYTVQYGSGANTFSADQGFSEHQLGTAVDFTTEELGASYGNIGNTEAFEWLEDNAHKYGFVLSYPEGNAYYVYEPWHWRFVGKELARDLHRDNAYLYDLEQREIDEYLITIFDK